MSISHFVIFFSYYFAEYLNYIKLVTLTSGIIF